MVRGVVSVCKRCIGSKTGLGDLMIGRLCFDAANGVLVGCSSVPIVMIPPIAGMKTVEYTME